MKESLVNQRMRDLYCDKCQVITTSKELHVRCSQCGSTLITVIYSILDGKPLLTKE